jgi:TolB protein
VAATGGEDSVTSEHHNQLAGATRTYVFTGERGLDLDAWLTGLRAGRSFVSSGPLVELSINGKGPGQTIDGVKAGDSLTLEATVRSITPLDKVSLIFNGQVVEDVPLAADRKSADFRKTLRLPGSGWYHLRAEGRPESRFPLDAAYAQAFTNPVWVVAGQQPIRSRPAAEYCLRWIDKLQQMAEAYPHWRSPQEKAHVFGQFNDARAIYRRFLDEVVSSGQDR